MHQDGLTKDQALQVIKDIPHVDHADVERRFADGPIGSFVEIPGPHPTVRVGANEAGEHWVEYTPER